MSADVHENSLRPLALFYTVVERAEYWIKEDSANANEALSGLGVQ